MDEFIKDLDPNLDYLEHEIKGNEVIIYVASNRSIGNCPYCGCPSGRIHSYYPKSFQDLPVMAKKTKRLVNKIVDISLGMSSVDASKVLRNGIADVGKSTVSNYLKKDMPVIDHEAVRKVCIDDFAFKKGHTYGTIMIDIETHKVIDMIDTRDTEKVTEWLGSYPDLEIVSRDGSVSYRKAIEDANKNIIQVSDRFHLLKGLTDAAKKHIMQILAANIGIPVKGSHYEGTEGCEYWEKKTADNLPTRTHNKNLKRKQQIIGQARRLYAEGYSISRIADELQISYTTAKKYVKEGYNPVNGNYNTKHPSKIKPYEKEIIQMLKKGMTFKKIEEAIRRKGYDGASSTIRMFATRERKLLKEAKEGQDQPVEKIERKWLISLLYKPIDEVSQISEEQLDAVIEKYPEIEKIYDMI